MASDDAVFDDGVLRVTRTSNPDVLAIAGEIDESNYRGLAETLARIADELSEIHFDLAGVDYCDLAGLRAIVRLAGHRVSDPSACEHGTRDHSVGDHGVSDHGREGRRVVLHAVPPQLKTVLGILGWDSVAGLALDERASGVAPRSAGLVDAGLPEIGTL